MAHHKAAIKSIKQSEKHRQRNVAGKTYLKTSIKNVLEAVASGNLEAAKSAFSAAAIVIDKSCSKGFIHKNNAARKKSRLALKVNALS